MFLFRRGNYLTGSERFWILVASRDHVFRGVEQGICQANHGKSTSLKRMSKGDWITFYSSKMDYGKTDPCMAFTAIGRIADDTIFQVTVGEGFKPFRRRVDYIHSIEAEIKPLIPALSFIKNKKSWGYPFRFGTLEIDQADFELIANNMKAEFL